MMTPISAKLPVARLAETLCLLLALVFLVPVIPSYYSPLPLFPGAGYSIFFFAVSRVVRHWPVQKALFFLIVELVGFAAVAWAMNHTANILLATQG